MPRRVVYTVHVADAEEDARPDSHSVNPYGRSFRSLGASQVSNNTNWTILVA